MYISFLCHIWIWMKFIKHVYLLTGSNVYLLIKWKSESELPQSCLTLCNPMDCSLRGSSVHGNFQARVLEWVAISFSRGSSWPRDWTQVSRIAGTRFTIWATREVLFINNLRIFHINVHIFFYYLSIICSIWVMSLLSFLLLVICIFYFFLLIHVEVLKLIFY